MSHKTVTCYILFSILSSVAAFIDDDEFLVEVQDSLDKVFADHAVKWEINQENAQEDTKINSREKRTGAFPPIKKKRKKIRACQNMAGIMGKAVYLISITNSKILLIENSPNTVSSENIEVH